MLLFTSERQDNCLPFSTFTRAILPMPLEGIMKNPVDILVVERVEIDVLDGVPVLGHCWHACPTRWTGAWYFERAGQITKTPALKQLREGAGYGGGFEEDGYYFHPRSPNARFRILERHKGYIVVERAAT